MESVEPRLELASPSLPAPADVRPRKGTELARRLLHDGRLRAAGIVIVAVAVSFGFESTSSSLVLAVAAFSASWILAVQLAARSLRTVRVLAGHTGVAAFGALGGLALVSALGFWVVTPETSRYYELGAMALGVFVVTLGCEVAKARVATLRTRVLLVGDGHTTRDVIQVLAQEDLSRFSVIGVVGDDSSSSIGEVPVLGAIDALQDIVEGYAPDLVVVSVDRGRPDVFARLAGVAGLGFSVVGIPEFYEHAFARVPVRGMTDAWFMSVLHLYQRPYTKLTKRTFDIVVALAGLLVTAPLFIVIAPFVRMTGPVFYRQTRLGDQGVPFTILKFRTMYVNAEEEGAMWAEQGDPRTTEVGAMLRRLRLDELPQLFNVLRGDMAVVGPRPERPEFLEMLEGSVPFWSRRHLLKPGVTGWAQLRSGYAADSRSTEEKLAYDLWYLRHQSLVVDLLICARTLPMLLLGVGR